MTSSYFLSETSLQRLTVWAISCCSFAGLLFSMENSTCSELRESHGQVLSPVLLSFATL